MISAKIRKMRRVKKRNSQILREIALSYKYRSTSLDGLMSLVFQRRDTIAAQ